MLYHAKNKEGRMKRMLAVVVVLLLAGAYVGIPIRGDDAPKEQTYVVISYCLNAQSVLNQRQSGKRKIIVGYSLPSLTPDPGEVKTCTKDGGVPMSGYVEVTPPLASLN
jgi:hypothetical protein